MLNDSAAKADPAAARFEDRLRSGQFVMTAEIKPPVSCDRADLLAKALPLKNLADAVNITDGAGARAHLGALAAAVILVENGIEPILQLTCRDRNRIALQSDLLGAAALGIRNLLMLRGDDPSAGDQPDAKPVFDVDTRTLIKTARVIRDHGALPTGQKVSGRADFFLGAADSPIDPPAEWLPQGLTAKVAAGAQFVQTQFCMDTGILRRYLDRLADHGITEKLHLLVGLTPLRSGRSARWMLAHLPGTVIPEPLVARLDGAADPAAEGKRICIELLRELAEMRGIAGAHIMAPGNELVVPEILAEAACIPRRASGGSVKRSR